MEGELDVAELVQRLKAGDAAAWEQIYLHAYTRLLGFAWRRLGSRQLADEAVSETMTRALTSIGRYRRMGPGPIPWLFGILRNVVREMQRHSRQGTTQLDPDLEGGSDPAELLTASEERELLLKAFSQLDPGDQEILELRVLGRLNATEEGTVVGKRPGAVRMAQTRAIERLRVEAQRVGLRE